MKRYGAGFVDAGASSAATFVAGVAATRLLDLSELGAYALVFATLLLATQLPTQMVLVPAEARLVPFDAPDRVGYLKGTATASLSWAAAGGLITLLAGGLLTTGASDSARWMLAGTGAVATLVSPVQDHARRMLHLAGQHRAAALVSLARLAVVGSVLFAGISMELPVALLPLGALAAGDLLPLLLVVLARRSRVAPLPFATSELRRSGSWLLVSAMAAPAAGFVASAVVTWLAGPSSLGLAEAARVTAQPLLVLAAGLAAVLGPRAMEAAHQGDRDSARLLSRRLASSIGVATIAYVLVTFLPAQFNPLRWAVPAAFELPGLTQVSIVAAAINAVVILQRSELVVLERTKFLARAEAWAGAARTATSLGAGPLHSWVIPLGFMLGGFVRIGLFRRGLDHTEANGRGSSAPLS